MCLLYQQSTFEATDRFSQNFVWMLKTLGPNSKVIHFNFVQVTGTWRRREFLRWAEI